MFASHSWPRWGNERIQEVMRAQRDTYAHLNNGVLHLANQGVTINEVHNVYRVPETLQRQWAARSYHGSVAHNARAVVNRYLGYWDGNPTTLIPLSPRDSAPLYVEMMGGADADPRQGPRARRRRPLPARHRDPRQAGLRRSGERRCAQPPGRGVRADRLPAGEPERAQQLPRRRARAAVGDPAGRRAQEHRARPGPGAEHAAVPRLPRDPARLRRRRRATRSS